MAPREKCGKTYSFGTVWDTPHAEYAVKYDMYFHIYKEDRPKRRQENRLEAENIKNLDVKKVW